MPSHIGPKPNDEPSLDDISRQIERLKERDAQTEESHRQYVERQNELNREFEENLRKFVRNGDRLVAFVESRLKGVFIDDSPKVIFSKRKYGGEEVRGEQIYEIAFLHPQKRGDSSTLCSMTFFRTKGSMRPDRRIHVAGGRIFESLREQLSYTLYESFDPKEVRESAELEPIIARVLRELLMSLGR